MTRSPEIGHTTDRIGGVAGDVNGVRFPSIAQTIPERREPVYESLQTRLREFVCTKGLAPGERLPAERELARLLGVSRPSLREAITALRVEGLVDVRHGDGIYLLRFPDDVVPPIRAELMEADPELPALGEVRNALEGFAARWAALRRSDEDLAAMVGALRVMEQEIAGDEPGLSGDRAFHAAVLRAARNPVLARLLERIAGGAERIASASLSRPGQPERSLAVHRLILDAIVARELDVAQNLMFEHLERTGEISPR